MSKAEKAFFFEKKKQKTFVLFAAQTLGLGLLTAAALPPLNLVPMLLFTIPRLIAQISKTPTARAAALQGLIFGFGLHVAGLYWVTNAILVMAADFWWAVPIAVPLLALVLAVFIAAACFTARLAPPGWPRLATFAGAWVLADLARQFVLSGFPWNPLGSTWEMPGALGDVFIQPACLITVHGLTWLTLLLAGAFKRTRRGVLVTGAALSLWAGFGMARLAETDALSGLWAVIVQGNVSEADHRDHGNDPAWVARVFDQYLGLTRAGVRAANGPAIVVWPETASPYALTEDAAARLALADAARPALMTLAGTVRFGVDGAAHNSLVAISPDARVAGVYDKAHLVPFGEYFPRYVHFLLGEQGFSSGPGVRTLTLPGLPAIGALICYEAIFPGQVVQPGHRPALLVNITNDAWFGDSAGPRQHLAAARMRSVEEGLPMLRAANTGISAVIDAYGRILASLGLNQKNVLAQPIPAPAAPTLASRLGLWAPFSLALLSLVAGFAGVARGRDKFKNLE